MFGLFRKKRHTIEHLAGDILKQIELDFSGDSTAAITLLNEALNETDYLREDRIVRCIIFLADKKLDGLKKSIIDAIGDPRDVMYWAEYIERNGLGDSKRVRDFNKPFDQNDLVPRED